MFNCIILSGNFSWFSQQESDPGHHRLRVIHEENAFSHINDPHSLQQPLHCSNVQSLLILKTISWLCHLVKSQNKLNFSKIQWHRIPIPIPKKRNWNIVREDWTKAGLKPSRAAFKSSSFVSDTWGFSFKGLRWLYHHNFPYISLLGYIHSIYAALHGRCLIA